MSSSQGDKRSSDFEMGEATSQTPVPVPSVEAPACVAGFLSFREKLARRKAEKEPVRADTELPSSSALAVAPTHGPEVQVPRDLGMQVKTSVPCVPDASAQPTGSSTTPILVEDKEKATESMPPPPARKEVVLALCAPSSAPVVQPKGQKRKCTKGDDGESSQQGGLNLASGLRRKFVSQIDGMISECGSEANRLARDLSDMQGKWFETEAMLKAIEGSHSAKVSKLEAEIGALERDLGKTASSLLKEKKAIKAKSSEVRRLQRQIESDEKSTSRGVEEAKDALRVEFQARLAKISGFLGSLECIRSRDFALATVEGILGGRGRGFRPCLGRPESTCFLPTCSEDPEGKDPVVGKNEGDAAPSLTRRWVKRRFRFRKMIMVTISLEREFFMFMNLFSPGMAMFYVSGLAACGFESLPLCCFFLFLRMDNQFAFT
ncbi:hypothetical protein F2Q69_00036229 [Brassica cretica]|uniref:Uncharacterized protein n=1 Tax=Brassica cretica TaxID=69181 RepID=A0A8S9SEY8_BRACR|nr:hypothetical protein F2Q69_00036229 [Brassica cretica]